MADFLRKDILLSRTYPAGSFIREEELARELNISRAPVREALRELEGQGLIRSIPRKGAVVLGFSPDDAEELYDIRFSLETRIFETLIERDLLTEDDYDRLYALYSELLSVASGEGGKDDKVLAFSRVDLEFHLFIAERSGRPWTIRILKGVYFQLHQAMLRHLEDEDELVSSAKDHLKVIEALKKRDLKSLRENRHYSYFSRRVRKKENWPRSGIANNTETEHQEKGGEEGRISLPSMKEKEQIPMQHPLKGGIS